jgi:hypothetical protein
MSEVPRPKRRNIFMSIAGWGLIAVMASLIVMLIEIVYFTIAVH